MCRTIDKNDYDVSELLIKRRTKEKCLKALGHGDYDCARAKRKHFSAESILRTTCKLSR